MDDEDRRPPVKDDTCKRCGKNIDREKLYEQFRAMELPSIATRAAASSKYCSFACAIER
jgi:hypothetical protein